MMGWIPNALGLGSNNGKAIFSQEGPEFYKQAYQHNAPFSTPGPYQTALSPEEEASFQQWAKSKGVPLTADYDMRRFWKEMPDKAAAWQPGSHFPDLYKTPYDTTFSGESVYAKPGTPFVWQGNNLIDTRSGQVIFAPKGEQ